MIFRITLLLSFLTATSLFAQKTPEKWGSVSKNVLNMQSYDKDSSANAVVLFDFARLRYTYKAGWRYTFNRHKRVKIFNENGYNEGDIAIYYHRKNHLENVSGIKAQVIKPNGEKVKLQIKDIFDEKINERYNAVKFSIPQLEPGAIVEYRYTLESKDVAELPKWYFQTSIPIMQSEFFLEIPNNLRYVQLAQGRSPEREVNANHTMNVYVDGGAVAGGTANITASTIRMWMTDVAAMKEEAYTANMGDFYASITFQLQAIEYFNGTYKPFLSNWEAFSKDLLKNDSFGKQYKLKKNFSKIAAQASLLTASIEDEEKKAQAIYDFISQAMTTERRGSVYVRGSSSLNDLFEKKVASKAEINLMLIAALNASGIDADPILLSTRSHGRAIMQYPIFRQFNTLIAAVTIGEDIILMDAGNPHRAMGYPAISCLNYNGFLVKENASQWINIIPKKTKETYMIDITPSLDGETTCQIKAKMEGYAASEERYKLYGEDEEKRDELYTGRLAERMPDAYLEKIEFQDEKNSHIPLRFELEAEVPNAVTSAGDKIYVRPIVYGGITETPFKLENRQYPVQFPFPWSEQLIINVTIPEGYVPEQLPESVKLALPNNGGKFRLLTSVKEDSVQIIIKTSIKQLQFEPAEYGALREFYNLLVQKAGEVVVFTKKA